MITIIFRNWIFPLNLLNNRFQQRYSCTDIVASNFGQSITKNDCFISVVQVQLSKFGRCSSIGLQTSHQRVGFSLNHHSGVERIAWWKFFFLPNGSHCRSIVNLTAERTEQHAFVVLSSPYVPQGRRWFRQHVNYYFCLDCNILRVFNRETAKRNSACSCWHSLLM